MAPKYTKKEQAEFDDLVAEETKLKIAKEIDTLKNSTLKTMEASIEAAKDMGYIERKTTGKLLEQKILTAARKKLNDGDLDGAKKLLDTRKGAIKKEKSFGKAVNEIFPGVMGIAEGIESSAKGMSGLLGPAAMAVAIFVALAKLALGYAKAIADTRKELGVSVKTAIELNTQNKILGLQAKQYGLDVEDIKNAQASIRQDLGASVQEAANLSLNFARTAAATGQTSEDLSKTLSLMESISSSSRDVLLNQIRTNAAMIEAAGIAPALVMKDIANNAEFFAQFAKDGGTNIIAAGVAARKLGLEMSAVAGISESLLDFESSIEKQMTASLLLGRQINLDKARQLALAGDQEGVMKEILKVVGGEAEFNKMNVLERKALAESVGVNVEQLSRLVRNNTAGGTAGAVGSAMGGGQSRSEGFLENMDRSLNTIAKSV